MDLQICNFIVVSLSIIAITGHLAEWMDVGLNEENETIIGGELGPSCSVSRFDPPTEYNKLSLDFVYLRRSLLFDEL